MSRKAKKRRGTQQAATSNISRLTPEAGSGRKPGPEFTSGPMRGGQDQSKARNWKVAGACALLVMLVFIVFGQTVGDSFVNFDDNLYVYENPVVSRGLSFEGLRWAITYGGIGHWHPLTWVTHMLDCQLYGLWAGGHHLTNVILHASAVVLLFLVLFKMTGAFWRCAFVAAIWAIHPLRAESVAWISERKDVLSALFFMLTLGTYVRYVHKPSTLRYLLVVATFALGLLSKNMLVTLPCVLLLLDCWPLDRLRTWPQLYPLAKEKIPLFALSVISCVITFLVPEKVAVQNRLPLWLRLENSVVSCGIYLRQTVWPAGLAPFYPNPTHAFPTWEVAGSLALLCLISAAALALRRRHPYLLVGWLWFLGMLVPVMGLVQIGEDARADRRTYLPQIGLFIACAWLAADWAGQRLDRRVALGAVATVILCTLPVAAYQQTGYWHDSKILWTHALECTQDNYKAHTSLGNILFQQGQTDQAIAHYREALRINPDYPDAHSNFGLALLQEGQADQAIAECDEALRIEPDFADAHNNLGNALLALGRRDQAIAQYREALSINPGNAEAHTNLGSILLDEGQTEDAIAQFEEALQINPAFANAHYNLGNALLKQGRIEEAIAQKQRALESEPANVNIQNGLAWLLATAPQGSLRDGARAVQLATEAREATRAGDPDILRTLAAAYAETGEFSNAAQIAQSAIPLAEANGNASLAATLRREMKLYQAGRRYEDP